MFLSLEPAGSSNPWGFFIFCAYTYLINRVRPALATSYAYVNPVIAVTIGVLIAGEKVTAAGFAAMLVIVAAVMMVIFGRKAPLKSD
ncbi:MAG: EamA family transporter [Deltaproteobacteria bacterium]|nr:EamA family transporter [Deltaproteobacteria bacterium]